MFIQDVSIASNNWDASIIDLYTRSSSNHHSSSFNPFDYPSAISPPTTNTTSTHHCHTSQTSQRQSYLLLLNRACSLRAKKRRHHLLSQIRQNFENFENFDQTQKTTNSGSSEKNLEEKNDQALLNRFLDSLLHIIHQTTIKTT